MRCAFGEAVAGAIRWGQSATRDAMAFMAGLRRSLAADGVTIREGADAGVERLIVEQDRIVGVALATGETLHADRVILAAGTWSGPLAATPGADVPMPPAEVVQAVVANIRAEHAARGVAHKDERHVAR